MKLRIHYIDGEHREIEFGDHPKAHTWYWSHRALIVRGYNRDRAEYPTVNIRVLEVLVEHDDAPAPGSGSVD